MISRTRNPLSHDMHGPIPEGFPTGVAVHKHPERGVFAGRISLLPRHAGSFALDTPVVRESMRRLAWFDLELFGEMPR